MGTISLSLPADGQSIDASDVNNPFNIIAAAINGNLDSNNILAGGVVPNGLQSGTGTSWAMQTYTPTFANTALGNGSVAGYYIQIGKMVFFRAAFTLNTTSTMGTTPTVSLPVTANANYAVGTEMIGNVNFVDSGVANYVGTIRLDTTTTATLLVQVASGTYTTLAGLTATIPFAWGSSDYLTLSGFYQAA